MEKAVRAPSQRPMNNAKRIALLAAIANLALILIFPPYDYVSLQRGNIPTFDGFHFAFGTLPNRVVNADFLALEIIVVLINACIAMLLLRDPPPPRQGALRRTNRQQQAVLGLVAINLILVLLFPPFEYFSAITKAALPTFEGFYFVFGENSQRQLVTTILYIEVALVMINGALLWLLFRDRRPDDASPEELRALAQKMRAMQKK